MNIVKWRRDFPTFKYRSLDNLFGGIIEELEEDFDDCYSTMKVDLVEQNKEYVILAELPGMNKDDISVTAENDILSIEAERQELQNNKNNIYIRERKHGKICRSFNLKGINSKKIEAEYKDGILKIILPKTEEAISKKIEIKTI